MNPRILPTVAVALLLVLAGCAGFGFDPGASTPGEDGAANPAATEAGQMEEASNEADAADQEGDFQRPSIQADGELGNFTALYESTIDSVVEIRVQSDRGQGQGSGFVYHADGYVVTNQHVVSDADEVSVGFADGTWRTGDVVGTDVYTDLALVRVDSLPDAAEPIPLADGEPAPGQPVAAIGSPLGFQGSITQGIVSGTNRSMPVAQGFSIPDTVQTDAAINPGNSGGPLVSMNGAVLGVNRATTGDNIGFAISADVVDRVVPSLAENGSYAHAYMGIRSVPVTQDIAEANDLPSTQGMMVVEIPGGSPAAGALEPGDEQRGPDGQPIYVGGDVIVGIDGQSITNQHDLARYLLLETQPGEEIQVTVLRNGERVTETLTLDQRPDPRTDGGL